MDSSDGESDSECNRISMFIAVSVKLRGGREISQQERCREIQHYLKEGVDVNAVDEKGNTVLHIAVTRGLEEVVKFLLENRAWPHIENDQGDTAITLADSLGKPEIAKVLRIFSGSPSAPPADTLGGPSRNHHTDVRLVLDSVEDLKIVALDGANGTTLLYSAVDRGDSKEVEYLLKRGVNIEARDKNGRTPLTLTVLRGHLNVAKVLLENWAKIEARDSEGNTPLHVAVYFGYPQLVKYLLKQSADIEARERYGRTPLNLAVFRGHPAMVKLLLEEGANVEAEDEVGWRPLSLAISRHHSLTTGKDSSIGGGVDIEARNNIGWAIESSVVSDKDAPEYTYSVLMNIVKQLIQYGADVNFKDKNGCSPLDIAEYYEISGLAKYLIQKGARK